VEKAQASLSVSERRACQVLGQHRSTQRKAPHAPDDEAALTADIIELAKTYGRYGYRRNLAGSVVHFAAAIYNTDQGSQFTSAAFTGLLADNAIAISMDGRGSCRDSVFVERLWRSVKYEEVDLRAYDSVAEARASLGRRSPPCVPPRQRRVYQSADGPLI